MTTAIDHVIYVVRDLEEAGRRFLVEHGLSSVPGGFHLRWGTANRIVPLGSDYIELMCVIDEETAAATKLGAALLALPEEGWFAFCVSVDDIDETANRLGLEAGSGSRTRPDGSVISWRSAGIEDDARRPYMPFFIGWDVPDGMHPGKSLAPEHPCGATGIARVDVGGDEDALRLWLGGADVPVRVAQTEPQGVISVALSAASGEILLR
jgi:catechol 2,3-dioxygenase-like lactoylglutathione lyase family enzyme